MNLDQQEELTIVGGSALAGSVAPDGYKHAMVLSIAASIVCATEVRLRNAPRLTETDVLLSIVEELGGEVTHEASDLVVKTAPLTSSVIPPKLSQRIHGSM